MRTIHAFFAFAIFFALALPVVGQNVAKKIPVPTDAAQAEATKLVKEVYGGEYANAKTTTEKQTLAKKLLGKANESKDDPASQFVLLRLARDIATQASDRQTAFQAIDALAESFQVDILAMKAVALTKFALVAQKPAQHKAIAEEALKLVEQSIIQDNFTVADALGKLALAEAQNASEKELITEAQDRINKVAELTKTYEDVKKAVVTLKTTPDDPAANLTVGKYRCFLKGNWDKGLPMLALGRDDALSMLAKQEIEGAASSKEQAKLGDGWWSLAEKQEGTTKKQIQARGVYWYKQALPGLSGLIKDKMEKRVKELDANSASALVLRYEWRDGQLTDWKWEGEGKPIFKNGRLEFRATGRLLFNRTDIRITEIAMDAESLDRTQALDVFVGENAYLMHFLGGFIRIGGGSERVVPVKLMGRRRTIAISIPSTGNTTLTVGSTKAMAPVKASGTMSIQVEQPGPLLIGHIVIKGVKVN